MINGSDLVAKAKSYIGKVNYVFGGDNIDAGVGDCSSFTRHIYNSQGINIGRDTQAQWTGKGEKVTRNNLSVGDLVFFKNTYNSNNTDGVSHVGIYSGNGNFIHLSSSGVKQSSLNENYWAEHYLGGKHITGVSSEGSNGSDVVLTSSEGSESKGYFAKKKEELLESITKYALIIIVAIVGAVMLGLSVYNLGGAN